MPPNPVHRCQKIIGVHLRLYIFVRLGVLGALCGYGVSRFVNGRLRGLCSCGKFHRGNSINDLGEYYVMSTTDNLKEAFAGESQANRKYLAFAKQAEQEDLPGVAKLFRAAAEAETVHAHAHLRVLDGVGETAENLKAAIEGEGFEFREMYPPMLALAKEEGNQRAERSFQNALAVEETHYNLYSEALKAVEAGQDLEVSAIYVCEVCGHTVIGDAPDRCPVCSASHSRFFEVQ